MQDNEKLLIHYAKEGDDDAFCDLVEAYQTPVFNLCYRMLGSQYEAEDAAQESFLRAYKSLSSYDTNRSFSTWLLSISAHFCINQIRRRKKQITSLDSLDHLNLQASSLNPEQNIEFNEEQELVRSLLKVLKPVDRAIVVLFYWYDYSYEEIANILNLTESAVKSRIHRARRELAKKWIDQISVKPSPESLSPCVNSTS
ncbi:MAG: sigma-70 family RNA polymerase sigma factor [Anaerolineales bacterium]|nr:sigma-70 family RNA polymerase sigma factor [Anaerolineales bacterium]